jgi:hypothetical protein
MESNSERNRIQVSQSTADLLIADGKGHWLTPRKDLVNAKGKGLLQTYWCEPVPRSASIRTSDSFAESLPETDETQVPSTNKVLAADDQEMDVDPNASWDRSPSTLPEPLE